MLPSRGLRPAQFVARSARQCAQFSSLSRTAIRASPLQQSARWRTGRPHAVLTASTVRHGSWYAPWSWGKPSTPAPGAEQVPVAEFGSDPAAHHVEPPAVVTTATPEMAPAGIDKAPVTNEVFDESKALEDDLLELLAQEPSPDKPDFDPNVLIDHAGQLRELGLDWGWGMTTLFEKGIEHVYLQSGWGWAGSIMASAVAVRVVTFYFQAKSSHQMAALAALKPITQPLEDRMKDARERGDQNEIQVIRAQQAQIMAPYASGMLSMGGFMFMQGYIGFSAFRCLRAMGELPVPGMVHDGYLWFADLTVRDPYFALPAITTAIFWLVFRTGGETGVSDMMNSQRKMVVTGFALFLGLITAFQPAGLQLYFLVTGIMGAGTSWLLRQPGFRRFLRINPIPSPTSNKLYSRIIEGQAKVKDVKSRNGSIRYQPPSPIKRADGRTTLHGLNIKATSPLPLHMQQPGGKAPSTVDDEEGSGSRWSKITSAPKKMLKGLGINKETAKQKEQRLKSLKLEAEKERRFGRK